MEFKKILISKNEGAISGELAQMKSHIDYFQGYINQVLALGLTVEKNDLQLLFENPKVYLTGKITHGESMQVGGLKLNKEKLFELLEKPQGTNEFIEKISKDLQNQSIVQYHIFKVELFEINAERVVLKQIQLDHINKRFSLFIENETQQKAFNKLEQIAKLVNEINELDGTKINLDMELSDLLIKGENNFKAQTKFIQNFK
ncbi:hypothetical protein K5L04_10400 [Flavobacterium psychrophilum]|uniref:hypothetical protein n=1 Tax=Flavobacterium psychrophilum TaxID=96345 RepID=UPI001C8F7A76|nr:hypothetical protein [Flavobacterium psychrophilum]QZL00103.1 hypothetical protein K5L04_10400 [Flavobacterium psychrophilum]